MKSMDLLILNIFVPHCLFLHYKLIVGLFQILQVALFLDMRSRLFHVLFNLHLQIQLFFYVGFLVLNSLFFQYYEIVGLFRAKMRLVILSFSHFKLSFPCISISDLHLNKLKVVHIIFGSQLLTMVSYHVLLQLGHFKLLSFELSYLLDLLQLILEPFLGLHIDVLNIFDAFCTFCGGMIINSVGSVTSHERWVCLKVVIF